MTVVELLPNAEATVLSLVGPMATRLQLQELGFTPGSKVTMVAKSPFMGPIALALRGTTIALRREEADCLQI